MTASSKVGGGITLEYLAYGTQPSKKMKQSFLINEKNEHEAIQLQIQFNLKIASEMENVGCNRNAKTLNLKI